MEIPPFTESKIRSAAWAVACRAPPPTPSIYARQKRGGKIRFFGAKIYGKFIKIQ
jgi:hypothetical protein